MRGATLLETMVALAILGMLVGMSAAAVGTLREPETVAPRSGLARARDSAIRTGLPVVFQGDGGRRAFLLPDGRALAPGLDPLTGADADDAR